MASVCVVKTSQKSGHGKTRTSISWNDGELYIMVRSSPVQDPVVHSRNSGIYESAQFSLVPL